jgi:hypothetical protein
MFHDTRIQFEFLHDHTFFRPDRHIFTYFISCYDDYKLCGSSWETRSRDRKDDALLVKREDIGSCRSSQTREGFNRRYNLDQMWLNTHGKTWDDWDEVKEVFFKWYTIREPAVPVSPESLYQANKILEKYKENNLEEKHNCHTHLVNVFPHPFREAWWAYISFKRAKLINYERDDENYQY